MKIKTVLAILTILLSTGLWATFPGAGGGNNDPIQRPGWWQGDWPPKSWGEFESGWNKWAPGEASFPCKGSGCDYIKDWIKGDYNLYPTVTLYSSPQPAGQDPQQDQGGCGNCLDIGFSPVPVFGLDYDRNKYIIYLGTDDVLTDGPISPKTGTLVGPFAVVEYGSFLADIGIKGMVTLGPVANISVGLKLSGSRGYQVSRIATTMEEVKKLKRLRRIPRTFKDFMELPLGTIIMTKMSGGIAFEASAAAGYVFSASAGVGAEGEWLVKVAKPNNYEAIVSITDIKEKELRVGATAVLPTITLAKKRKEQIFFSFQINLESPEGIEAYEDFFKGRLLSIQHVARKHPKLISQMKKDQHDMMIYKPLIDSKQKAKANLKTLNIGLPFIGAFSRNLGSENVVHEELRYLSHQDITELGEVEKGTMLHSFRGSFSTGKNTTGLLSSHRERLKEFSVKLEDIIPPDFEYYPNQTEPEDKKGWRRMFAKFEYKFHKNNWSAKDWSEEIKFMARRTGFKEELLKNMPSPIKPGEKVNFIEFQADLKISEKALRTLAKKVARTGAREMFNRLNGVALFNLQKWFSDPKNQKYEQCDNIILCKKRVTRDIGISLKAALDNLARANDLFVELDIRVSDKIKRDLVKVLMRFGGGISKNQFTLGVIIQELLNIRADYYQNDFTYCFQWKGSTFRANQFVLIPSGLRTDRNQCYLKEEIQVDEIAKRNDRDLFGDEFILD